MLRSRQPNDQQELSIDALCINQEDSRERTQQVQLMERIYQSATETNVWLGDHFNGAKEGISLAKKLAELDRETFAPLLGLPHRTSSSNRFSPQG